SLQLSQLDKIFLTNDLEYTLTGFDTTRYVPCLRTDDLVFHLDQPEVLKRLQKVAALEDVKDTTALREAIQKLFDHFSRHGAKACAISLPPDFSPQPVSLVSMAKE